jgi:hypothetical protein
MLRNWMPLVNLATMFAMVFGMASAPSVVRAQDDPLVTVAVASLDEQFNDIKYIAKAVGKEDEAKTLQFFASAYIGGFDRTKPSGVMVYFRDGGPSILACLPVKNLDTILELHKDNLGEPKDAGDGCKELRGPNGEPIYFKYTKESGWLYVSNQLSNLDTVPADPGKVLIPLARTYNVAVEVNVAAVPAELKSMFIDQINQGVVRGLDEATGASPEERELQEKMAKLSVKQFERMAKELDRITFGISIDQNGKDVHLDVTTTALDGTELAKEMAATKEGPSEFSGFFNDDDSAATLHLHSVVSKSDLEQLQGSLSTLKDRWLAEIAKDGALDEKSRKAANEYVNETVAVLTDVLKQERLDSSAALLLEPRSVNFAAGVKVPDGTKFEALAAKLVQLAKNDPDLPKIKLNVGKHKNINLHALEIPIPPDAEDARDLLGDPVVVTIGTAPKAVYAAFGRSGEALLKRAIDASVEDANETRQPFQLSASVRSILNFVASMNEDNPILQKAAEAFDATPGEDEVSLEIEPVKNGQSMVLSISEECLKWIAEASEKMGPPNR